MIARLVCFFAGHQWVTCILHDMPLARIGSVCARCKAQWEPVPQ